MPDVTLHVGDPAYVALVSSKCKRGLSEPAPFHGRQSGKIGVRLKMRTR
jgi:hypothetical protein